MAYAARHPDRVSRLILYGTVCGERPTFEGDALVEEETVLAHRSVRNALLVEEDGRPACHWEGLMGKVYTLGLDEQQREFLGLVLGMIGIGLQTLSAVRGLDERRLLILMRALPVLADNDRIAVGTRM